MQNTGRYRSTLEGTLLRWGGGGPGTDPYMYSSRVSVHGDASFASVRQGAPFTSSDRIVRLLGATFSAPVDSDLNTKHSEL